MKKGLLLFFCLMLLPSKAMAIDYTGIYVAPRVNYSYTKFDTMKADGQKSDDSDNQWGGQFAIGYDFETLLCAPIRAELEYGMNFGNMEGSFSKNGVDAKNKLRAYTLFANVYWDITARLPVTPYLGAGIGIAWLDSKGHINDQSAGSKTTTNLAFNAGAGFGFNVTDNFGLDIGYRFVYLGDAKTGTTADYGHVKSDDVYQHQVSLGARITF